jgi:hypothetical protein
MLTDSQLGLEVFDFCSGVSESQLKRAMTTEALANHQTFNDQHTEETLPTSRGACAD